jgi:hypothetical protein
VHEVADADRLEEDHLVHRRGDRRATGVPLRHDPGDVVHQLHHDAAVHRAEQVRVETVMIRLSVLRAALVGLPASR